MPSNLIANRPRIGYVLPVRFDGDRVVDKSEPSDFLRLDGQCSALFFFLLLVFIFEKPFSPPRGGGEANGTSVFIADLKRTGPNKQLRFLLFCRFLSFLEEEDDDMNRWQVDRPAVFHRCRVEIVRWLTNGRVRLTYESINDVRPKTEMRFKFRVRLRKWFEKLAANYDQHLGKVTWLARLNYLARRKWWCQARALLPTRICVSYGIYGQIHRCNEMAARLELTDMFCLSEEFIREARWFRQRSCGNIRINGHQS